MFSIKRMLGLCGGRGCLAKARVEFPTQTGKGLKIQKLCHSSYKELKDKGSLYVINALDE